MRRFTAVAIAAAALSVSACGTANKQRRQDRVPAEPVTVQPDENRPLDSSPMRGDETYPSDYTMPGPGREINTGSSGAQIDRNAATGPARPPQERAASGRRSATDSTVRPAPGRLPPSSAAPPPGDEGYVNPYDLGAAKSPRDGGAGAPDGGSHFESSPNDTGSY
jgi:hypothetical protein